MNDKLNPVKLPELLAPAGNLESAVTAFESGADAVYAGLGRFNAREMGENFIFDDMSRLKNYTVKKGKKLYLTFNTLVKENELEEFGSMIRKVSLLEPDAVIVQDTGAVQLIRDNFPSINIHASTQMAIHNSAGVMEAAEMGICRVILERQVSLDEIRKIMGKAAVEVEVFIHGALCCSLSGQCLLSSWLGGFSGNRGKCKQPCRRLYSENGKEGFFLSPGDLCAADLTWDFIEAGISSLKIEGRLKRGDYIKNTVSSYRKILDYYSEGGKNNRILSDNIKSLSRSYTRELTHGFYNPVEIPGLIKPETTGLSGKLIGQVCEAGKGFFKIRLADRLHIGDKIRIHNRFREEKNIITVTSLSENSRKVKSAGRGSIVTIATGKRIPVNGKVYKTGETVSVKINRNKFEPYIRKIKVDLAINLSDEGFKINFSTDKKNGTWEYLSVFEKAESNPATPEIIESAFRKTASESLEAGKTEIKVDGDFFIPASILKKIKNSFWNKTEEVYAENIISLNDTVFNAEELSRYRKTPDKREREVISGRTVQISEKTILSEIEGIKEEVTDTVFCSSISFYRDHHEDSDYPAVSEIVLPHFCSESRLEELEKEIDFCYRKGIRKYRITSLYQLKLLEKYKDIEKSITYPLPVANSAASYYLRSRGVKKAQGWIELDREALRTFSENSTIETEIYLFGLPFIFATRAMLKIRKMIRDDRGNVFYAVQKEGMTYLYPDSCIRLENRFCSFSFYDLSENIPETEGKFSDFNFSKNFQ